VFHYASSKRTPGRGGFRAIQAAVNPFHIGTILTLAAEGGHQLKSGQNGTSLDTLHLPSINKPAETGYRFIGVFHTLNQRRALPCYLKQTITQIPKLDVAGSSPVSRSMKSTV
jgi:hypothetical protein